MNKILISLDQNKLIFQNDINPYVDKTVTFLNIINQEQLQTIIKENVIDLIYYYMQQKGLFE